MAEVIRMPLLSDTMKEGVIATWLKNVGDTVKSDDIIAEVETDKATMEVMGYADGTLLYIGAKAGVGIPVNGVMAVVGKPGEDFQSLLDAEAKDAPAADAPAKEEKPAADDKKEVDSPAKEDKKEEADKPKEVPASTPATLPKGVTVVEMPLLSDTMKEGKIVSWNKKVGDEVKSDDVLADVETDKATMEIMGYADGTLLYIGVPAGEAAKINDIIAIVGPKDADVDAILAIAKSQQGGAAPAKEEEAPKEEAPKADASKADADKAKIPVPANVEKLPADNGAHEEGEETHGRIRISPLARRLAEEKGIEIQSLQGSGDGGRIIKRDIDNYKPVEKPAPVQQQPAAMPAGNATPAPAKAENKGTVAPLDNAGWKEGYTDIPNSKMRSIIAARLTESKNAAPHFYLRISVEMDNAMAAREQWNAISPAKISFNDFTIKAVAMALRQNPDVNVSWMGDSIRQYDHINVGTAVAIDGGGLIVPVVRFADKKSLSQIASETKELIGKVRSNKIQPADYSGNTFTISNLGMMDIDDFTAIINPPDACILAVGKIAPTPVAHNGEIVIRNIMRLTLSCDHRAVDGAVGARFMQSLKAYLEAPVTMLV